MGNLTMPVLFIGHGSPMNAIHNNDYTADIKKLSVRLPEPAAVLVISAHWLTRGTRITSGDKPDQIYDFYGFPDELYTIKYQPPGSPEIAAMVSESVKGAAITPDEDRGIDHAAWAVLRHIFPDENIPVLELSLDMNVHPADHYKIGKALSGLRDKGILIMGSGNIVHNLSVMDYYEGVEPQDWAVEFDKRAGKCLLEDNHTELIEYEKWGKIAKYAVPTDEHYIPMLYAAALKKEGERLEFIHESIHHGTISMRSFIIS
ncbi:MAG TPA: 4,5-DOPA dioxygenase extradiol [Spirochaetota bacterium]|nr:4,5-DOPA dioxygenase extradiol [Spirochaetota bacterium]HPS86064.1 4,5-DOPA dioxygenase extradiol [Spirochaetota bacterium]